MDGEKIGVSRAEVVEGVRSGEGGEIGNCVYAVPVVGTLGEGA